MKELLLATKPAARTTLEDIAHLRELVGSPKTSATYLRHSSVILRRLILEGELARVAGPRLESRFLIEAKQLKPVHQYDARSPLHLFASMGCNAFGVQFDGFLAEARANPKGIPEYHPDNRIALNIDSFTKQKVICLSGKWASRRDVIQYVANKAGGAHQALAPNGDVERLLTSIRERISISVNDEVVRININDRILSSMGDQFSFIPGRVDAVLLELLAAAAQLVNSPDCGRLEKIIDAELAGCNPI